VVVAVVVAVKAAEVDREPWHGFAQPIAGGYLLLGPRGVLLLSLAIEAVWRATVRDPGGGRPSSELAELRGVLAVAADDAREVSFAKVGKVSRLPERAELVLRDPIGAVEVAGMYGCSVQWARRLCADGVFATATKRAGVWQVERAEVTCRLSEAGRGSAS
jgi:hypothetical protein